MLRYKWLLDKSYFSKAIHFSKLCLLIILEEDTGNLDQYYIQTFLGWYLSDNDDMSQLSKWYLLLTMTILKCAATRFPTMWYFDKCRLR